MAGVLVAAQLYGVAKAAQPLGQGAAVGRGDQLIGGPDTDSVVNQDAFDTINDVP